ncbi:MAG: hypothetical protein AAF673_04390 [Pseudomonadota bacterium]
MKLIQNIIIAIFWTIPFQAIAQEYYTLNYKMTCNNIDSNDSMWKGEKENTKYLLRDYESVIELQNDTLVKFGNSDQRSYHIFTVSEFKENNIEVDGDMILIDSMLAYTVTDYANVEELVQPIKDEIERKKQENNQRAFIQKNRVKFETLFFKVDTIEKGGIKSYHLKFQNLSKTALRIDSIKFNKKRFQLNYPENLVSFDQVDSIELIIDSQCLLPRKYKEEILIFVNLDATPIRIEIEFVINDDTYDISGLTDSIIKRIYGDTVSYDKLQLKMAEHNEIQKQTARLFQKIGREHQKIEFNELFFIDTISTKTYIILPNLAKQAEVLDGLRKK